MALELPSCTWINPTEKPIEILPEIPLEIPPEIPKDNEVLMLESSSNRVWSDVLLSIKHAQLADIVNRQKNHEYRKYRLRDGVTRLWLYETGQKRGSSSITHIAVIPPYERLTPGTVPEVPFGKDNSEFNAGLTDSKYGYAILELYELVRPVTLEEMKTQWDMAGAPLGWRYMLPDLWKDHWAAEDREQKLRKVF